MLKKDGDALKRTLTVQFEGEAGMVNNFFYHFITLRFMAYCCYCNEHDCAIKI